MQTKIKTLYVQKTYNHYHFAKDMEDDLTLVGWELVCIHNARILSDDFYVATFRREYNADEN